MRKTEPLVSIGVPVHNGERTICQALDSLLGQSYTNLEIIISDNASTDGTAALCSEYAARDPRVRYYRSKVKVDLYANFRRVLELSSGEYFMWGCDDDIKPRKAVEDCVRVLVENDRAVMAHGPVLVETPACKDLTEVTNAMDLTAPDAASRIAIFTNQIRHSSMLYGLYKRAAVAKATLNSNGYGYGGDYLLCLQICFLGPIEYVSTPMIIYSERTLLSSTGTIADMPLTLKKLLTPRYKQRMKCSAMLFLGAYYLLKIPGPGWKERMGGIAAHLLHFSRRYRVRMAKELLLLVFLPAGWITAALRFCRTTLHRSRRFVKLLLPYGIVQMIQQRRLPLRRAERIAVGPSTILPISEKAFVEVYWVNEEFGPGPSASVYVHDDEVMRLDAYGARRGHMHLNIRQTCQLPEGGAARIYFVEGNVLNQIDRSVFELRFNLAYALKTNWDPSIRRLRVDSQKLALVAERMRDAMLRLVEKHRPPMQRQTDTALRVERY